MKDFILGDCMEGMKAFEDNYFDLAIVDPQTGQGEDGRKSKSRNHGVKQKNGSSIQLNSKHSAKDWDSTPPEQSYYDELFRVSKHQIIMCENYLQFNQKSSSAGRIVWNMLRDNDFSDAHIMWQSFTNKIHYYEFMWNGMLQGIPGNGSKHQGDKSKNEKRIHPVQKPVSLYHYLLREFAQPDFKLLSTHVGSASDLIAFEDFGCEYVGYEIDPDYYADALKRLNNHKAQLTLFND